MKNKLLLSLFLSVLCIPTFAQNSENPVQKGDYNIFKFDVLNLMGVGVQKIHIGYEIAPMKANENNLPTMQFNATVPFNSLNEDLDVNYGIEGGMELRFYQKGKKREYLSAEGFYMGVALDGGYTEFSARDNYYNSSNSSGDYRIDQFTNYKRVRTGIAYLLGGQARLGEKLYFDGNIGIGWSNVNVNSVNEVVPAGYEFERRTVSPPLSHYQRGKSQRFYMPLSFGIGYNFGNR